MPASVPDSSTKTAESESVEPGLEQASIPAELPQKRNFLVLTLYQVLLRMGWIFKTESIIMPAVVDSIGGAGWLRGCLPLLNRFGQSVPPMLMARRVKVMRRKKWATFISSLLMSALFLCLAALWLITGGGRSWWLPIVFLSVYALFFMVTGVNQLCLGTIQGKLIRADLRGRLLLVSTIVGAAAAIACAWLLLPGWLHGDHGDFGLIFGFAGICFGAMAISSLFLREDSDNYTQPARTLVHIVADAVATLRDDANFRRLAIVAALFGTSMMLFPHYQALGRKQMHLRLDQLILWVIVQNAGTALFSLPAGPLADRYGNRLALRLSMLGICGAPLAAVILAHAGSLGQAVYYLVFVLVGLTPVTIKLLNNYTLEICEASEHPRYLSTLSLCAGLPIMALSPLVGWLIDLIGFDAVFLAIAVLLLTGWLLTFGLREPRHHVAESRAVLPVTEE